MRRRDGLLALLLSAAGPVLGQQSAQVVDTPVSPALPAPPVPKPTPPAPPVIGELKQIGQDRFQLGRIVIDKGLRRFSVPGRIRALDKPLEYLATTPNARKAYETLLDLDTSGSELQLACILIGLERDPAVPPFMPLSAAGVAGMPVRLTVAWPSRGGMQQLSAAEALLGAEAVAAGKTLTWEYTGSITSRDGAHLASDATGSLISFVKKDPTGVINAALNVDPGPYGAIRGSAKLPPEGSPIELIVEAAASAK